MDRSSWPGMADTRADARRTTTADRASMDGVLRRSLLLSVGAIPALSGCLGNNDSSDTESTGEPSNASTAETTETDDRSDQEAHVHEFKTFLEDESIAVVRISFDPTSGVLTLSYHSTGRTDNELANEIGTITGGFLSRLENGFNAERLEATIVDGDEAPIADWYVNASWYDELNDGEITPNELSVRVLDTLELR